MPVKLIRNKKLLPELHKEGVLSQKINLSTNNKHGCSVGSRLYSHHTLASVRQMHFFHPFGVPQNSLDFILDSTYNHSTEFFPDKVDIYLQPETHGCETWRLMRNTRQYKSDNTIPLGHPLQQGGITAAVSPFSVKLMNSGVHSSQTNPGYSRQPAGGAIFFY